MKRLLAILCVLACLFALCAPVMAAEDTITVKAKAPEGWTDVYVYMWNNMDAAKPNNGAWPGMKMEMGADGWYEAQVPNVGFDSLIINNGNGGAGNQTADMPVDGGCDLWVIVDDSANCGIAYSEEDAGKLEIGGGSQGGEGGEGGETGPVDMSALTSMAIVGAGIPGVADWDPADPAADMEKVEDYIYVKEIVVTEACSMNIKFAGNDGWVDAFNFGSGTLTINGEATELECSGGSSDMALSVAGACTLKFTLDLNAFAEGGAATVKVESADAPVTPPEETEPSEPQETKPEESKPEESKPEGTEPAAAQEEDKGGFTTLNIILIVVHSAIIIGCVAALVVMLKPSKKSK